MDKDKLLLKRHEALEGLEASLQEELIAARLEAPDEEKGVEVLTVIFPELGLDGDGANQNLQRFNQIIFVTSKFHSSILLENICRLFYNIEQSLQSPARI